MTIINLVCLIVRKMTSSTKRILVLPANPGASSRLRFNEHVHELTNKLPGSKPISLDKPKSGASQSLHNKIVEFLKSLPNIHEKAERRALIYSASLDKDLEDQIEFEGTTDQFCHLLVLTLARYGTLNDSRNALASVLETTKQYVGQELQAFNDSLLQELRNVTDASISPQQLDTSLSESIELKSVWVTRLQEIQRTMLYFQPNIVHFLGYGQNKPGILFEDESGQIQLVKAEALARLFALFAEQLECVILDACYSETQAQVLTQHVSYVIGISQEFTSYSLPKSQDFGAKMAREFTVAFYEALGLGKSFEFAYQLACNAMYLADIPEQFMPVLLTKHGEAIAAREQLAQVEQIYRSGLESFKNNDLEHAQQTLLQVITSYPEHLNATLLLGRVYLAQQAFGKAIEILEQAYQTDPVKSQSLLLQALKAEIDHSHNSARKIELYERILQIQDADPTIFKLQDQLTTLKGQLANIEGYAVLEAELVNRQEDLIRQDELVLKFQIKNTGNIPANKVAITLDTHETYQILSDSSLSVNSITAGEMTDVDFHIQPLQEECPLNLIIAYRDAFDESIKEQSFACDIRLSRQPTNAFKWIENPYRSGNLTQYLQQGDTRMFYGRRETIQELKHILVENDEGLVIIYGQRRTGKSCLLKYIEKEKCLGPELQIVFTNIQGLASEQDFYHDVLSQVTMSEKAAQHTSMPVNSFDEFAAALNSLQDVAQKPFLIMLDEFESLTDERFKYTSISDATDFIRRFRNLIQYSTRFKFALAGADGLRAMIGDYHNSLFKAGRTFHISFLNPPDARSLITEPLQDKITYTKQAVKGIQLATANHPYYIQLLCQTIVMLLNSKKSNRVTITEVTQAFKQLEKTGDSNFEYVWDITSKEAHLLLTIIAYEMQEKQWITLEHIEDMMTKHKLSLSGQSIEIALKALLEKDLIIEHQTKLEYTIPMGLLHTWITHYKPLKKVRREFISC